MGELTKQLAALAKLSVPDDMGNPMVEEASEDLSQELEDSQSVSSTRQMQRNLRNLFADGNQDKKKKAKKGSLQDLVARNEVLTAFGVDELADELDYYLDDLDEDDLELRNSLVSMGRKYQRDHTASAESAEITKTFSGSEKKLKDLFEEIARDKESLQKDIDQMRLSRSRNFKAFSDMITAKNSFHSTQLSILKEMNAIKKTQYDLKYKEEARKKDEDAASASLSSNTIKELFSLGRGNMISAMGGYENISGAVTSDEPIYDDTESEVESRYMEDLPSSEGDKFLEYENRGVEYVLIIDEDDHVEDVIAEDRDGNVVPDYPLPTNFMELNYDIDKRLMRATDDYHRNYKVRIV